MLLINLKVTLKNILKIFKFPLKGTIYFTESNEARRHAEDVLHLSAGGAALGADETDDSVEETHGQQKQDRGPCDREASAPFLFALVMVLHLFSHDLLGGALDHSGHRHLHFFGDLVAGRQTGFGETAHTLADRFETHLGHLDKRHLYGAVGRLGVEVIETFWQKFKI